MKCGNMKAMSGEAWLRWSASLSDGVLRAAAIDDWLRSAATEDVISVLDEVIALAEARDSRAQVALAHVVAHALGAERLQLLAAAAPTDRYAAVLRLLLPGAPRHKTAPTKKENPFLEKSLGERKALARRSERQILDRLLFDQHPSVVAILLANPRVSERDVVKMAALSPTRPEILLEIARSPKWIARHAVKKALVENPHMPANQARSLLAVLPKSDWRQIAKESGAPEDLRQAARELLERQLH